MSADNEGRLEIRHMIVGPVQTNCYVLRREGSSDAVVVDPGDEGERIIRSLDREGWKVSCILLTHGHFDHIGAVQQLKEKYGARIYAPAAEQKLLEDAAINLSAGNGRAARIEADEWVTDAQTLDLGLLHCQVITTPGHTAGSACYYLPEEGMLLSGDTLFAGSVGRTDFPTGDWDTLLGSLHKLVSMLPPDTRVYPGHGPATDMGTEKRSNPYFRR